MGLDVGLSQLKLVKKIGVISYIHITHPELIESIYSNGLRKSCGNFGIDVIYVADKSHDNSIEALAELSEDYIYDAYDDDFVVIHGTYHGEYLECIAADKDGILNYNIGFVGLLNEDKSKINKHVIIKGKYLKNYILSQYSI